MNEASKLAALSVLRSILIAAGSYAVSKGYIDENALNQLVGGLVVVIAAAWGAIDKLKGSQ